MSGHSKFANIKHKKEKNDAAKGKIFTIIGREIAVAVKEGGPDVANNFKLAQVVAKAKANNMPNDTIERGIKKAAGNLESVNYVYNTYLNSCELGKLIVLYKEMKVKKNTHKDILRHMKILEYAIEVGDYATGQNELFFLKSQYNTLYLRDKEMVSAYESMILHHQTLVEYFYERRETPAGKKFYKKLKMRNRIGQTTYFKVCFSYWNVLKQLEMKNVVKADPFMEYIMGNGGDTLYVKRTESCIRDINNSQYKKDSVNPWKELGIVSLGIVLGIIILNFVIYNPQGDSISSTYAHYYRTNMKDVCVLQEKDSGEKVFAIIYDRKDLAYCIFDKIKIREEDHYIVRNIYKLPWKSNTNRLLDADEYKEMLETENEYAAKAELQTIVVDFYVRNGVVSSDKEPCEGYSLNPYISNIEVEEGNLSVEPVQIGEDLLYRWTLWR